VTGSDPRPVLVTGMPRSGTTWVGRMLCAGGHLGYLNEPFNLATSPGTIRVPVRHWFPYVTAENEELLLPELTKALKFRYPLARELAHCRTRTDLLHTLRMWKSFVGNRRRRPLVKEPHAVFSADWFARRLGSDVVVTVRHPVAVVSSWKRLEWGFDFGNLLEQPALVRDRLGSFENEMRAALEPSVDLVERVALLWAVVYHVVADLRSELPELHVLRHEDLSRRPVEEYRTLFERLGLSFEPDVAAAVASSSSGDNPKQTRVDRPHETAIDSSANLDNWRLRLSDEEIARIRRLTERTARLYYTDEEWR
jgi:hypothetical protein